MEAAHFEYTVTLIQDLFNRVTEEQKGLLS